MSRNTSDGATRRWGPYAVATVLLATDFALTARGLSHAGPGYARWALDHTSYSDIVSLSVAHYMGPNGFVHPLPYVHDRIEYPVLLGFTLWLPSWLPGGPATWFAAAGVMTTAATFGSIALLRRHHPASVWWLAAAPALLLDAAINWDLIGVFFLVGAVVWFGERRLWLSGASAAAGTFFKLFPVVVAPMALAALAARRWRRPVPVPVPVPVADRDVDGDVDVDQPGGAARCSDLVRWLIAFVAVSVVVVGPFLVLAPANTLWFFRFNSLRSQKDSLWGLGDQLFGPTAFSEHTIDVLSLVAVVAATVLGVRAVWRTGPRGQTRAIALASTLVLLAWMIVNKVWNPQYILWVAAAAALTAMPARFGVALGAVSVYDYWVEFVLRHPDRAYGYGVAGFAADLARAVLFVAMAWWAVVELRALAKVPSSFPLEATPTPSPSPTPSPT